MHPTTQKPSDSPPLPSFNNLIIATPAPYICHCQLARPPVNALNTPIWTELLALLTHLEEHHFPHKTRVLVISSSATSPLFSAGNDLTELHAPSTTALRFAHFWKTSTVFLARFYKTPLYTISIVCGRTPAAACVMCMAADFRIASTHLSIGLNEVAIGLPVPAYWARLLVSTLSSRARAEHMLAVGDMISADDAHSLGIIHLLVSTDTHDLHTVALAHARVLAAQSNSFGRVQTKLHLRRQFAEKWETYAEEEAAQAWKRLSQSVVADHLSLVMRNLRKNQGKAKM